MYKKAVNIIPDEKWLRVENFFPYFVSNQGRIKTVRKNKRTGVVRESLVVGGVNEKGYRYVTMYWAGRKTTVKVHRLVMIAFVGQPTHGKTEVNHKNGVKLDNRLENLEWSSHKQNMRHYNRMKRDAVGRVSRNDLLLLKELLVKYDPVMMSVRYSIPSPLVLRLLEKDI